MEWVTGALSQFISWVLCLMWQWLQIKSQVQEHWETVELPKNISFYFSPGRLTHFGSYAFIRASRDVPKTSFFYAGAQVILTVAYNCEMAVHSGTQIISQTNNCYNILYIQIHRSLE